MNEASIQLLLIAKGVKSSTQIVRDIKKLF